MHKILVFVLAFAVGIGSWFLTTHTLVISENRFPVSPAKVISSCFQDETGGGQIKISPVKIRNRPNGSYADFVVTNGTCGSVEYWAGSKDFPTLQIKADGMEVEQFLCGTGLSKYRIPSGGTRSFSIPVESITYIAESADEYQIGIWFGRGDRDGGVSWSNEFRVTEVAFTKEETRISAER